MSQTQIKIADYITEFLHDKGVRFVFELTGGMITRMLDSIHQHDGIDLVSFRHEQGAAFAAEAVARMSGVPGVAMGTSGPGATNLLTGIGSCYFDSVPALFITGQVNRHELRDERGVRQQGFQELDIVAAAKPMTKGAWQIKTPEEVPARLNQAYQLAMEGRPGPVLLDIPMDVQKEMIDRPSPGASTEIENLSANDEYANDDFCARLGEDLENAQAPLILCGGGIRSARVTQELRNLLENTHVPVVHSLMGVDVLPSDHPLRVGLIGSYGNRWANYALAKSDLLLVLGSRLDVRQTGADTVAFKGDRRIYHVDCVAEEMNNRVKDCITLESELDVFLKKAGQHSTLQHALQKERPTWRDQIVSWKQTWPAHSELAAIPDVNPNQLLSDLSSCSSAACAFVSDVGQHQMWAAQSLCLTEDQRFLNSGGMGSMGFGLPAAIGASLACDRQPVVLIAGDGGFQCNIQELQTVVHNQLPIKMVIMNNQSLGMVRQFQKDLFESRFVSTLWGYSTPDFVALGSAYNVPSRRLESQEDSAAALQWLWSDPQKPALLEVKISDQADALPKMAFGQPLDKMEPDLYH